MQDSIRCTLQINISTHTGSWVPHLCCPSLCSCCRAGRTCLSFRQFRLPVGSHEYMMVNISWFGTGNERFTCLNGKTRRNILGFPYIFTPSAARPADLFTSISSSRLKKQIKKIWLIVMNPSSWFSRSLPRDYSIYFLIHKD